MNLPLILAYLFFIGSVLGWVMELFFRKFFSKANPEHRWINPGFCTGPYLPLYGTGLCVLYLLASLEEYLPFESDVVNKIILFFLMALMMTVIEFIAGFISLKVSKVRLWDYTGELGNIMGIICPKFSLFWAILGGVYYFFIHPYIKESLAWLSRNLAFSFFIGLFFGVFIVDMANSAQLLVKLKHFAEENEVILRYENIKAQIRTRNEEVLKRAKGKQTRKRRYQFLHPFATDKPINEVLKEYMEELEERTNEFRKKIDPKERKKQD
ncbi:MAG: putative ABC transporter permease [Oscillospiraceae bacterium]|nr:putative ABC transporter permease [Oscillospiraceae bacterium]